jgi:hypothetical protein
MNWLNQPNLILKGVRLAGGGTLFWALSQGMKQGEGYLGGTSHLASNNYTFCLVPVAHVYNPSYLGGWRFKACLGK